MPKHETTEILKLENAQNANQIAKKKAKRQTPKHRNAKTPKHQNAETKQTKMQKSKRNHAKMPKQGLDIKWLSIVVV